MRFNEFKIIEPSSGSDLTKYVLVQKRDSLSRIAKALKISLPDLIAANPQIKDPDLIHPGDKINVPGDTPPNPIYPEIPRGRPGNKLPNSKDDGSFDNAEKARLANHPNTPKDDGSFDNAEKARLGNHPASTTNKPVITPVTPIASGDSKAGAGRGSIDPGRPVGKGRYQLSSEAEHVFNFFTAKGLTDVQAAAFVGNAQQESGIDPTAAGDFIGKGKLKRETSGGIFQWHDDIKHGSLRYEWLRLFAFKQHKTWTDIDLQLNYAWKELTGSHKGVINSLNSRGKTDITVATRIVMREYENPKEETQAFDNRLGYAKMALELFGTKPPKKPA